MSEFGIDVVPAADGVAWMVIRNPARRNALRLEMWSAIPEVVARLDADAAVRVVVLRGDGTEAFASGADISEFTTNRADPESAAAYEGATSRAFAALLALSKPLVAMVHGPCMGGGLALALCADVRIAAADARFALPAARLGVGYHMAGVERMVRVLGPAQTAELLFAALQYDADAAQRMGLVNRVLPAADLEPFMRAYAVAMARNAPLTQRAAKSAIRHALDDPAVSRAIVQQQVAACFASEDYAEGVRAFLEKRRPSFKGR